MGAREFSWGLFSGAAIGLTVSLAVTRPLIMFLVSSVGPYDPISFAGVTLVLLLVGAVACLLPARRATEVDPMVALRYE